MEFYIKNLSLAILASGVFFAILPLSTWAANRVGLIDRPSGRKQHAHSTPLVGGITIFVSFFIVSIVASSGGYSWTMLLWLLLVLVIGIADDLYDLSQKFRLIAHALVVMGIAYTDGHLVLSVGSILSPELNLDFSGSAAVLFSAVAVIGAINAVNMIDGVDGLLGTLVLITLIALLIAGVGSESVLFSTSVISIFIGSMLGFLAVNSRFLGRKNAKVFMGDAGSTTIGFVLVYLMISGSQGSGAVISPVVAGWLLGLPLLDASAVIAMRLLSGKSAIKPARDHLHHFLLKQISSTNLVVATMAVLHLSMVTIGLLGPQLLGANADFVLFWVFVGLVPVRCLITFRYDSEWALKKSRV